METEYTNIGIWEWEELYFFQTLLCSAIFEAIQAKILELLLPHKNFAAITKTYDEIEAVRFDNYHVIKALTTISNALNSSEFIHINICTQPGLFSPSQTAAVMCANKARGKANNIANYFLELCTKEMRENFYNFTPI